jgi:16S rRNA (uracil1498-N3)-methyltransferase
VPRPRFYVPAARSGAVVELPAEEAHHFRHVLRLSANDDIAVFDGLGHEWAARARPFGKRGAIFCELRGSAETAAEPPVSVTLAIGALKGDQMDAVVRDITMLGAQSLVPIVSEHVTTSRRAAQSDHVRERWHRIAVASAKQCGRAFVPVVMPAMEFRAVLESFDAGLVLMCVEPSVTTTATTDLRSLDQPARVLALVGPEGGWSAAEITIARDFGVRFTHLGPRTLRAATAPAVLLSALWTVWGW